MTTHSTCGKPCFWLSFLTAVVGTLVLAVVTPASAAKPIKLLAFGDSLTAGYGLPAEDAFPAKLEAALRKRGHQVTIINSGVSGETTAGGRARLAWATPDGVDGVILSLGANDALRGLAAEKARENLDAMIRAFKERGVAVLLAGMQSPANWGPDYKARFDGMYADLAKTHDVLLYPFFLDGVVADPALNQADRIHPNAKGVDVIVARILPSVEKLIARTRPPKS